MCLTIDTKLHAVLGPRTLPAPRIAGYDMLVWKGLENVRAMGGESPYMCTFWTFGEQKTAKLEKEYDYVSIGEGLHGYVDDKAQRRTYRHTLYPAIIPKGALFYFGENNEIVSDRMTVYKTIAKALQGRTLGKGDVRQHQVGSLKKA